jgi:photosystem II stability/assembly factor-like uncharacterized protein
MSASVKIIGRHIATPAFVWDENPSPWWQYWDGLAWQDSEPCSFYRKHLYHTKVPRFMGQNDYPGAEEATDPEYMAYQIYLQTGQCPRELSLQYLLDAVAAAGELDGNNPLSDFNPAFSGLLLAMNDYDLTQPISLYDWMWSGSGSSVLSANWTEAVNDGSVDDCGLQLNATGWTGFTSWDDVLGFRNLHYTQTLNGADHFTIEAKYEVSTGVFAWAEISGRTDCLNLASCSFSPQPYPNDLANAIEDMMNLSQDMGTLGVSQLFNNSDATLMTPPFAQVVTNTIGSNFATELKWIYSGNGIWSIVDNGTSNTTAIELHVTDVEPASFDYLNMSADHWFENLNTACENFWTVDVMKLVNGVPTLVATLSGDAWLVLNNGQDFEPLALGSCEWPAPLECVGTAYDNFRDLFNLMEEVLPNYVNNMSLNLHPLFTDQLAYYLEEPESAMGGGIISADELLFKMNDCDLILYASDIPNFLGSIESVVSASVYGNPDLTDNYYQFQLEVELTNGTTRMLIGESCIPLKACGVLCAEPEPPLPLALTTEEELKRYIIDESIEKYPIYENAVADFNSRLGLNIGDEGYINAKDYHDFFFSGDEHAVAEYKSMLEHFLPGLDAWDKVDSIDKFTAQYGNFQNPLEDYIRYAEALVNYNAGAQPGAQISILSYVSFTDELLASTIWDYISYISSYSSSEPPTGAVEYRNFYYGEPETDVCAQKYQSYLNAYRYFVYQQSQNETCPGFEKLYPLYSFEDFVLNELCCNSQTLAEFNQFIDLHYTTDGCPEGMPFIKNCEPVVAALESPQGCQDLYKKWLDYLKKYNQTAFARHHQHVLLVGNYSTYQAFVNAGLCDCVREYLSYLETWLLSNVPLNTPLPVDIWNWEGCKPKEEEVPCYDQYLETVYMWNAYVLANPSQGLPGIRNVIKEQVFILEELCDCYDEWRAYLLMAIASPGSVSYEELLMNINLDEFCADNPCVEAPDSLSGTPLPPIEYINPCEQQLLNLAYGAATLAYEQYINTITDQFIALYNAHCLSVDEDFIAKFDDQEYHFTLYYYDQAGNLVKTVPPAGVERLDVTSVDDELYQRLLDDREFGSRQVFTTHRLATTYVYNSLNQLVGQSLPDHELMTIWETNLPSGLPGDLRTTNLQMVNENLGYLTGVRELPTGEELGCLYRTLNGGATWQRVNNTVGSSIRQIAFYAPDKAIAVGEAGTVMQTLDGGNTWFTRDEFYDAFIFENLNDICFESTGSSSVGMIVGEKGTLVKINIDSNNDVTLTKYNDDPDNQDDSNLLAVSWDGSRYVLTVQKHDSALNKAYSEFYSSTNGSAWNRINIQNSTLRVTSGRANSPGLLCGEDGQLFLTTRTINNTTTEHYRQLPTALTKDVLDAIFFNPLQGIAVITDNPGATSGHLMYTLNGGESWQSVPGETNNYKSLQWYAELGSPVINKVVAVRTGGAFQRVVAVPGQAPGLANVTTTGLPVNPVCVSADHFDTDWNPALASFTGSVLFCKNIEANSAQWTPVASAPSGVTKIVGGAPSDGASLFLGMSGSSLFRFSASGQNTPASTLISAFTGTPIDIAFNEDNATFYVLYANSVKSIDAIQLLSGSPTIYTSNVFSGAAFNSFAWANDRLIITGDGSVHELIPNGSGDVNSLTITRKSLATTLMTTIRSRDGRVIAAGSDGNAVEVTNQNFQLLPLRSAANIREIALYENGANLSWMAACDAGKLCRMKQLSATSWQNDIISSGSTTPLNDIVYFDNNTIITSDDKYMVCGDGGKMWYKALGGTNSSPSPRCSGAGCKCQSPRFGAAQCWCDIGVHCRWGTCVLSSGQWHQSLHRQ